MKALRDVVQRQKFAPGLLGIFTNPFFHARRALYRSIKALAPECSAPFIDVGCGSKPYRTLFDGEYIGVEIDTPLMRERGHAEVFYNGVSLPFADGHFGTTICNQVLEHVFQPDLFIAELARVTRPGGMLLLTAPFVWDEHEQPVDFCRYSSFGLKALLERNGFNVICHRKTLADFRLIGQLINAYVYKTTWSRHAALNGLALVLLMAPVNALSWFAHLLLPRNEDLYLDNVVLAERIAG